MTWLIVAGGVFVGGAAQTPETPDLINHTLLGEEIPAKYVVCRNRWGTPMLPDGKGGYSLIAPINQDFIDQSLIIPPKTGGPVFRPLPPIAEAETAPAPAVQ